MGKPKCPHSHTVIAATLLVQSGFLSAYEAVYDARCPSCGVVKRNTRLAATIHSLRHTYGWLIETVVREGSLAEYVLHKREAYPRLIGEEPLVSPLRKTIEDVPVSKVWACAQPVKPEGTCGARTRDAIEHLLGGYVMASCIVHRVVPHRPAKEGT